MLAHPVVRRSPTAVVDRRLTLQFMSLRIVSLTHNVSFLRPWRNEIPRPVFWRERAEDCQDR
jgi:hypothetical protein